MAKLDQNTIAVFRENKEFLEENADDITYRMYDILFRRFPLLRGFFGRSRETHPNLLRLLLNCFVDDNGEAAPCCVQRVVHEAGLTIKPSHLQVFREASVEAMQDVLFHEATPELVNAWLVAYDEFAAAVAEAHAEAAMA